MQRETIVIGAGVGGLMSAFHLHQAGQKVTVIEKGDLSNNTSFGNAGLLSAFCKEPLAAPGILQETIKLLLKKKSPLYFGGFPDMKTLRWACKFFSNANKERVKKSMALFERYGAESNKAYDNIQNSLGIDLDFHQKGFILAFTDEAKYNKKFDVLSKRKDIVTVLTKTEERRLAPVLSDNVVGSFFLDKNTHIDPTKVILNLRDYLAAQGVEFIYNEEITDLETHNSKVTKIFSSTGNAYEAQNFVMATATDIGLARKLGQELMLIPTKGYSLTFNMEKELIPKVPILFGDKFIIMTPRENDVRITSKLEVGSRNHNIVQERVDSIVSIIKEGTKDFNITNERSWCGFRPLTPNDMPLIGRDDNFKNFVYCTGLGWLGMTFGPAIGRIISELIVKDLDNKQSEDILLFSGFYQG